MVYLALHRLQLFHSHILRPAGKICAMAAFALTIFTGAFLLFQVQPLIGKYILPWFGGGPGVWTACLLFFQLVLLGGYAYAHFTSRWLKPRVLVMVHLFLLLAALALLPITPSDGWKPNGPGNPTLRILALLTVSLGLPYFVLSSTGPLMQQWFSQIHPGRSPFRLYALSNAGSLLALVSYPFFVETHFTRKAQAAMWGWGLVAFVVFCAVCAVRVWRVQRPESKGQSPQPAVHSPQSTVHGPPSVTVGDASLENSDQLSTIHYPLSTKLLWLVLPACASVLLLATTNIMCQDISVIPFLWVLPLALYLLSFIICFDSPRWYKRFPFTLALIAALGAMCWALLKGNEPPLLLLLAIYSSGLFVCCMVSHGELYRLKPEPSHLTLFYLMISAGGALGGVFVALVAPLVFRDYYELQWGLVLCGGLFVITCLHEPLTSGSRIPNPHSQLPATPKRSDGGSTLNHKLAEWRMLAWLLPAAGLVGIDQFLAGLARAHPETDLAAGLLGLRVGYWVCLAALVYFGLISRVLETPGFRWRRFLVLLFVPWTARQSFHNCQLWRGLACTWLSLGLIIMGTLLGTDVWRRGRSTVEGSRNFYGVLTVYENAKQDPNFHNFLLAHGRIRHGLQVADAMGATWPTLYYSDNSGAGLAIRGLSKESRRIGIVGLGIGTLAAYARTNDWLRAYEINPEVLRLATSRFTYLSHCYGSVEYALGDARLSLQNEPAQHFDLLALDAFASDAIPIHLLTREAFTLYDYHLKPNGVIAVHVTNGYLDLEPVLANVAREFKFNVAVVEAGPRNATEWWIVPSWWVLLTRDNDFLKSAAILPVARPPKEKNILLWTDDFASLFQILK